MAHIEDEATDEDFFRDIRASRKNAKENILDETFRKAEIKRGLKPVEEKSYEKRPFLKLGIVLIIIAIISLIAINYGPWVYVKFDSEYGTIQEFYNRDFKGSYYYNEIDDIFESPCGINCSSNSKNFIGIEKSDMSSTPRMMFYIFIIFIIMGLVFTIFEIVERKKKFSIEIVNIIHSVYAAITLFIGIFVAYSTMKFFSVYFLVSYNTPFIESNSISNIILIFPIPIFLLVISFMIIMIAETVLKINFYEFHKKIKLEKTPSTISNLKFGGSL